MDELSQHDPFAFVTQQHAREAALLWQLWYGAIGRASSTPSMLASLERRLFLHIRGLRYKPDLAWAILEPELTRPDGGTVFVATQLAFRSRSAKRKAMTLAAAQANAQAFNGFVHGMAALPDIYCYPAITQWLKQQKPFDMRVALDVFTLRRRNPGGLFDTLLHTDHALLEDRDLRLAAIRCARVTRRLDAKPLLAASLQQDDPVVFFNALYAALLARDYSKLPELRTLALQPGPCQLQAAALVARVLPPVDVQALVTRLVQQQDVMPALAVVAAHGDPMYLPWLTELMHYPDWARPAGTAFTTVTGLDLVSAGLSLRDQRGTEDRLRQDSGGLAFDPGSPWPDVNALQAMLKAGKFAHLQAGERYLAGELLAEASLASILQSGTQGQRRGAALEYALLHPAEVVPGTLHFISGLP